MPATEGILCEIPRRCSTASDSSECSNAMIEDVISGILTGLENLETRTSISSSEGENTSESTSVTSSSDTVQQNFSDTAEFQPPSDELVAKIVQQLEFYFSDDNLTKDAFLLKHVRRNKEGYVSLKLVSSFKKIKCLTKDWRVVLHSVRYSENMTVNEEETKLRRNIPFVAPEVPRKQSINTIDQTPQNANKTVIATNLDSNRQTIESVAELFSQFGSVTSVRIMKPGVPVPADLKSVIKRGSSTCAVIEFAKVEEANRTVTKLGGRSVGDWRSMHVFQIPKPSKGKENINNQLQNVTNEKQNNNNNKSQQPRIAKTRISESGAAGEPNSLTSYRRKQMSLCEMRQRGSSFTGNYTEDKNSNPHNMQFRQKASSMSESAQSNPWFQRRMQVGKDANCAVTTVRRVEGGNVPDSVIRLPRGPDGTSGFHMGAFHNVLTAC